MIEEKTKVTNPARYELIDKDGTPIIQADNPHDLILTAERLWPDQEQDPDRTGKGWDIQVSRASHYS